MTSWKTFALRTTITGAVVVVGAFVGVRLAKADPGGPTLDQLTFSGVLRERADDSTTLTFVFHRGTATSAAICTAPTMPFTPDANGAFSVAVPISVCANSRGLFDGEAVFYDVYLGSTATGSPLVGGVNVTAVPYARFADQAGVNSDCPAGYERETRDATFTGDMRLCVRRGVDGRPYDEVVRVGRGATAFWIDRYEATVWNSPIGSGSPLGTVSADYPSGFPANGQWGRPPGGAPATPLYALSRAGAWNPSRFITWFMAQAACRGSGKRLATGEEWLAAANGSDDLLGTTSDGADGRCVTNTALNRVVTRDRCKSVWGAQDMIGNVTEMTAEWMASVGRSAFGGPPGSIEIGSVSTNGNPVWTGDAGAVGWPTGVLYGGDRTFGVSSAAYSPPSGTGTPEFRLGVPSIITRGGTYRDGATGAGVFYYNAVSAPTYADDGAGFRCVVPR